MEVRSTGEGGRPLASRAPIGFLSRTSRWLAVPVVQRHGLFSFDDQCNGYKTLQVDGSGAMDARVAFSGASYRICASHLSACGGLCALFLGVMLRGYKGLVASVDDVASRPAGRESHSKVKAVLTGRTTHVSVDSASPCTGFSGLPCAAIGSST